MLETSPFDVLFATNLWRITLWVDFSLWCAGLLYGMLQVFEVIRGMSKFSFTVQLRGFIFGTYVCIGAENLLLFLQNRKDMATINFEMKMISNTFSKMH